MAEGELLPLPQSELIGKVTSTVSGNKQGEAKERMLTPRERRKAKKEAQQQAALERRQKAEREHPEWFHATSTSKKRVRLPDMATPIYKPEKPGKTYDTQHIQRYHKKVRRGI